MDNLLHLLNLTARCVIIGVYFSVLHDMVVAMDFNGPVLTALRDFWVTCLVLMLWTTLGFVEEAIDFLPGFSLKYEFLDRWVWLPTLAMAVALWRVRDSLRGETLRKMKEKFKDTEE
jgi:hypothetical protein